MIKTKFTWEKSLIGGLLSFLIASIIFTGCGKDYDYDIARLTKKTNTLDSLLNDLQTKVAAIQANIANARWITEPELTSTGYLIRFSDGTSIAINHGSPGEAAQLWTIGHPTHKDGTHQDSVWFIKYPDGRIEATDLVAIPPSGRNGVDGAPGTAGQVKAPDIVDGYLVTYEWNEAKNDFDATTHWDYPLGYLAYVTDNPADPANQWLLRVKQGAEGDGYASIILPKNASGLPESTAGNITLIGHILFSNATTLSLGAVRSTTLEVKYWYLDSIYNVTQGAKQNTWEGQKKVRVKQLLTTSPKEQSLVLTSDVSISDTCRFKNSRGEVLPLVILPYGYTGLLTKAENISGGSVYKASVSIVDSTYATAASVASNFADKFVANAVYYLENKAGLKSNYSSFSISVALQPLSPSVTEAKVTRLVAPDGGSIEVISGEVTVVINVPYTLGFSSDTHPYDYHISSSSEDIVVYPELGSFKAMLPGTYSLTIRKLHVDGKIYEETISVIVTTN